MKIAILSRNARLYSTVRLVEAARARGHSVRVLDPLRCYMRIAAGAFEIHYKGRALRGTDAVIDQLVERFEPGDIIVVDAGGGVGGIRVIRSSGSPELDQAALAVVRRAAPFPPIPPQAGRSSWAFTLPLGTLVR